MHVYQQGRGSRLCGDGGMCRAWRFDKRLFIRYCKLPAQAVALQLRHERTAALPTERAQHIGTRRP